MRQLTLDETIDHYEAALETSRWDVIDIRQYAPAATSPEYWPTVVELLRIRLEHAFHAGQTRGLEQTIREFPGLLQQPERLAEIAYEEYRLRHQAGQSVSLQEYQDRWDIDTSKWPKLAGPEAAVPDHAGSTRSPNRQVADITLSSGELFGPFRILCLLGRGALAKVYLAQQLDLSERAVVLKVCAQATLEPQKIALLQHPHIVQIFSVHQLSGFQVLCMPYAGATTLAELLVSHLANIPNADSNARQLTRTSQQLVTTLNNRQREIQTLVDRSPGGQAFQGVRLNHGLTWPKRWHHMRYEEIACELLLQLSRGLAHAHQHGIIHSDLKPANVLIGDDGQARLVDFNVAQHNGEARRSLMGGTLPYMAPEHIRSLRNDKWQAGPASDLYSLGVIAFQLLSGNLPFPTRTGAMDQALDDSLADRQQLRWAHRLTARHASPDVRSIIDKLLQPELKDRYASADQLVDDLQRHVTHLPLKHAANRSLRQRLTKWAIRHPRLSSASTVISLSAVAMVMLATALIYYQMQFRTEQARQIVAHFQDELPTSLVLAAHYREIGDFEKPMQEAVGAVLATLLEPDGQTPRVALDYMPAGDKALLSAGLHELENILKHRIAKNQPAAQVILARATTTNRLANLLHPDELQSSLIESAVCADFHDMAQATGAYVKGDIELAIGLLTPLVERSPHTHAAWLLLGTCHQRMGNTALAEAAYLTSTSLVPNHWLAWYYRAQLLQGSAALTKRVDQLEMAEMCYSRVIQLEPGIGSALFNRALCRESLGHLDLAFGDANQLILDSKELVRAHFLAARIERKRGRAQAAAEHTRLALASQPQCSQDYVYLGSAQLSTDRQAAAEAFQHAWELNPRDDEALQSLAYLAMELNHSEDAGLWLDRWVEAVPLRAAPVASRAVFHARHGRADLAQADCLLAQQRRPSPREQAQIASAFVLLADRTEVAEKKSVYVSKALSLLAKALQNEWRLTAEVAGDADIRSLQNDSRFQAMMKTARLFSQLPKLVEPLEATQP